MVFGNFRPFTRHRTCPHIKTRETLFTLQRGVTEDDICVHCSLGRHKQTFWKFWENRRADKLLSVPTLEKLERNREAPVHLIEEVCWGLEMSDDESSILTGDTRKWKRRVDSKTGEEV